jgi:acid phosphatase family membrane protein YuiD
MIQLYFAISLVFAYIIMIDLENLRHTTNKTNLKDRKKINEKILELEKDLNIFIFWPWLLIKKARHEYQARK